MQRRGLLRIILIVVALALAPIGGIVLYGSLYRSVSYSYWVDIVAPDDLDWSLWIPRPKATANLETQGIVFSVASIETIYGVMDNATGKGTASIARSMHYEVYAPESGGRYDPEPLEMSGTNDSHYWVWRSSSDPAASLQVFGAIWSKAVSYSEEIECGLPSYGGPAQEGWSSFSFRMGDCSALIGFPGGLATAGSIFGTVIMLVVFGVFIGRGKRVESLSADSQAASLSVSLPSRK